MTGAAPTRSLTRRRLYNLVWARPMNAVAKDLGISANGLAKICDRLLIPYPSRGHWAKAQAGRAPERPELPAAPVSADGPIEISPARSRSRRPRTRFSAEARRDQLIDAAAVIITREGLHGASMKRLAREVGISEAQAHNYFPRCADLLTALARRELHAMDRHRIAEQDRGENRLSRMTLSTVAYLRQASERGALIQMLLSSAEVREALRPQRQVARQWDTRQTAEDLETHYGLPPDFAAGTTTILSSVCKRAGRLLAGKKLGLEAAERLSLAIVTAGNRDLVRAFRPPKPRA